ncbi:ADP-ribosylation factor-like protein 6-interacting protein 1 [Chelonus insularis]|uniref:ADP-ribosylation factor-like protein 6-interacting protein 1 n=1 Tax=Chelonus insularis TaxID=460826 RepID=UPI00158AE822|nr:ADP-ribosylation factor-like protein 6-interacting protein 1 [Chelonus insularis]
MLDFEKEKYMKQLKKKMECWREIILPLNSILLWEKPWYPGLIFGSISIIFLLIWLTEPAFLTIISISLLVLALTDYLVPILISTFIPSNSWNGQKERKFDEICQKVSETILQIKSIWKSILSARNNRPNVYYGLTTVCLSLLAWLGNIVNNLLLIYLMLMVTLLLPGLRHQGRAQSAIKWVYNCLIHHKQA